MAGVWELTLSSSHLYICLPTGKPSPPCLGTWISELSAGRRAQGPGVASYLRDQGLRASTADIQALFLISLKGESTYAHLSTTESFLMSR